MSFSNEQILNSLISFYARKGVDMSYVLGDPIFRKLPVEDQVEAIKKNADRILAGTSKTLTKPEKRLIWQNALGSSILAGSAAAGVVGAVMRNPAFSNTMNRNKSLAFMGGTALAIGGAAGYISGRLGTDDSVASRKAVRKELELTAKTPTNENALGALAASHLYSQVSAPRRDLAAKIINVINGQVSGGAMRERLQSDFENSYRYHDTPT